MMKDPYAPTAPETLADFDTPALPLADCLYWFHTGRERGRLEERLDYRVERDHLLQDIVSLKTLLGAWSAEAAQAPSHHELQALRYGGR
jgi:hypothetical protein